MTKTGRFFMYGIFLKTNPQNPPNFEIINVTKIIVTKRGTITRIPEMKSCFNLPFILF